jgi:hypothetical protein
MKKLSFTLSFCLLLLTTGMVTSKQVAAQSADPLRERLDYLKATLEKYLTHSLTDEQPQLGSITLKAVDFETCKVSWKIWSEFADSAELTPLFSGVKMQNHVSVDLSSIDPARTRIYVIKQLQQRGVPWSLALELRIRPGYPGFKQQIVTSKGDRVTRMPVAEVRFYDFVFNTKDQLVAEQVATVFGDVSNICRSMRRRR